MKIINLTLPAPLRQEADAAAKDLGVSRSALIRTALEEFLKERHDRAITESIDRYIAKHGAGLSEEDEAWIKHSQATIGEALKDDERRASAKPKRKPTGKRSARKKRDRTK